MVHSVVYGIGCPCRGLYTNVCTSTSHEMGVSAWKISIVFSVDVGFGLGTKS